MNTIKTLMTALCLSLSGVAAAAPVNVNTAPASVLDAELLGVGPTVAQRIVEYRQTHGPFQSPAELTAVKGIGQRTLEKNAENILID